MQRTKHSHPVDASELSVADPHPDATESAIEAEQMSDQSGRLARLVSQLSPRQQEILRLRMQAGLSYREIAEVTGLTVSRSFSVVPAEPTAPVSMPPWPGSRTTVRTPVARSAVGVEERGAACRKTSTTRRTSGDSSSRGSATPVSSERLMRSRSAVAVTPVTNGLTARRVSTGRARRSATRRISTAPSRRSMRYRGTVGKPDLDRARMLVDHRDRDLQGPDFVAANFDHSRDFVPGEVVSELFAEGELEKIERDFEVRGALDWRLREAHDFLPAAVSSGDHGHGRVRADQDFLILQHQAVAVAERADGQLDTQHGGHGGQAEKGASSRSGERNRRDPPSLEVDGSLSERAAGGALSAPGFLLRPSRRNREQATQKA